MVKAGLLSKKMPLDDKKRFAGKNINITFALVAKIASLRMGAITV